MLAHAGAHHYATALWDYCSCSRPQGLANTAVQYGLLKEKEALPRGHGISVDLRPHSLPACPQWLLRTLLLRVFLGTVRVRPQHLSMSAGNNVPCARQRKCWCTAINANY